MQLIDIKVWIATCAVLMGAGVAHAAEDSDARRRTRIPSRFTSAPWKASISSTPPMATPCSRR